MFQDESNGFWKGWGVGGEGKAPNPAVSLYPGLFSTFLSLPLRLLPFFIFGNISFSWVRPVTLSELSFLLIFLLAEERKMAVEISLHSKSFLLFPFCRFQPHRLHSLFAGQNARYNATTFLPSILICSAAVLVLPIDDPWVYWYACQIRSEGTFPYFAPVFKTETLDRMKLKL